MARTFPGSVFLIYKRGAVHLQDFPGKKNPSRIKTNFRDSGRILQVEGTNKEEQERCRPSTEVSVSMTQADEGVEVYEQELDREYRSISEVPNKKS